MDDLISRAGAIKAICEDGTKLEREGRYILLMASRKQRDADILSALPTVDAVPVVRCRNCRFSQRINDWVYYCYVFNVDKVLNQYCDMGERKDGCDEKAD